MSLKDQLEDGLKVAMKSGDRVAVAAIRLSLSEIKNAMIDKRRSLEDNEIVNILRSGVKKRQESIEMFSKGNRPELVEKETAEIKVIEGFLPAGLSAAELEALVAEAIAETQAASMKDIGKIMKWIVPRIAGRADGAEVNKLIRARFSAYLQYSSKYVCSRAGCGVLSLRTSIGLAPLPPLHPGLQWAVIHVSGVHSIRR